MRRILVATIVGQLAGAGVCMEGGICLAERHLPASAGRNATAPGPADHKDEAYVLLRNENVLEGYVQREGDSYIVSRDGAFIRLPAYQVAAVRANLAGIYEYQRQRVAPQSATDYLKLAEWCLEQGLLEDAEEVTQSAARIDASHPRLPVVRKRLAVAREPAAISTSSTANGAGRPPREMSVHSPAKAGSPVQRHPHDPRLKPSDRMNLPEDTMEQFGRAIQPILLNSCTAAGCHSNSSDGSLVLDRRPLWRDSRATISSRNLREVLGFIDIEAPRESRLLKAAATVHADGQRVPPLAPASVPFARLEEWVLHLAGADQQVAQSSETQRSLPIREANDALHSTYEPTEEEIEALLEGFSRGDDRISRRSEIQRGVRITPSKEDDPFSAEEFNRRFSPR